MAQTINNLSETWNAAGTTFTGIKFNVTDTASAAGSLLMDLQVGGVSVFTVSKNSSFSFKNQGTQEIRWDGSFLRIARNTSTTPSFTISATATYTFTMAAAASINWTASNSDATADLRLYRGDVGTLDQRNGTNAQTFRLYGTYTDASNYRRLTQTMSTGGVAEIKPEGAGTGASGNVLHISGLPTSNPGAGILWNDAGTVKVGT